MVSCRKSGILLHLTALPGSGGIGCLGPEAERFIDGLQAAGQSLWQVLPLGPTAYGNSPYMCYSAFAGNPLLIDLEKLVAVGDLAPVYLCHDFPDTHVDFQKVIAVKSAALVAAAEKFFATGSTQRLEEFWHFCDTTAWLHDFALFMALKERYPQGNWRDWPADIASRNGVALATVTRELGPQIGAHKYRQWQFFRQWHHVRTYANQRGIGIFGDIPIFVAYDSADVWANPGLFNLDADGKPTVVAGVPPDYFSKTGQLWGNPLYDWEEMARQGYSWWVERVRASLQLYDLLRIDHFRGFAGYWEVPAGEKTAVNGRWVPGPGADFFTALIANLGPLPLVAEDLGVITTDVEALRDQFAFPGMKILQFAFDSGSGNPYLPHNYQRNAVVYTGTHDNDTTAGWFASLSERGRARVLRYLDRRGDDIVWDMNRTALASVADTVILPLQDVLGLSSEARMNTPGTASGNWSWRLLPGQPSTKKLKQLRDLTELYGRIGN
jgi:4-alpha-glucanotransferase